MCGILFFSGKSVSPIFIYNKRRIPGVSSSITLINVPAVRTSPPLISPRGGYTLSAPAPPWKSGSQDSRCPCLSGFCSTLLLTMLTSLGASIIKRPWLPDPPRYTTLILSPIFRYCPCFNDSLSIVTSMLNVLHFLHAFTNPFVSSFLSPATYISYLCYINLTFYFIFCYIL